MSELDFGISTAEIEKDIEYILFKDDRVPQDAYAKLKPMVDELVAAYELHLEVAINQYKRDLKVRLFKNLQDELDGVIETSVTNKKEEPPEW